MRGWGSYEGPHEQEEPGDRRHHDRHGDRAQAQDAAGEESRAAEGPDLQEEGEPSWHQAALAES